MTLSLTPAAVCQCFTLVSLCTSIADPNWIEVRNTSDPSSKKLIYGVAFTLHAGNQTDKGPLGGPNGLGMWLLYGLAALCYATVLFSSSSFLVDFLGIGSANHRLLKALHTCTAVMSLSIIGVFSACMIVISRNLQKNPLGNAAKRGIAESQQPLQPYVGESLFIAMLGIFFSCSAAGLSIFSQSETSSLLRDSIFEEGTIDTEPLVSGNDMEEALVGDVPPLPD